MKVHGWSQILLGAALVSRESIDMILDVQNEKIWPIQPIFTCGPFLIKATLRGGGANLNRGDSSSLGGYRALKYFQWQGKPFSEFLWGNKDSFEKTQRGTKKSAKKVFIPSPVRMHLSFRNNNQNFSTRIFIQPLYHYSKAFSISALQQLVYLGRMEDSTSFKCISDIL